MAFGHSRPAMLTETSVHALKDFWTKTVRRTPDLHVVLGSGFGEALQAHRTGFERRGTLSFEDIPGLFGTSAPDHQGAYEVWTLEGERPIVLSFQCGRLHGYEGRRAADAIAPVRLAREAGVDLFLLSNAAGGLRREYSTGSCMVIQDHVNWTFQNPLIGATPQGVKTREPLGPRFPDMSCVYDPVLSRSLVRALDLQGLKVYEGIYFGLLGPSFETKAEISMLQDWQCGAVGMSTVWEAIWLSFAKAQIVGLSLISNLGTGLDPEHDSHSADQILKSCRLAANKILDGILSWVIRLDLERREEGSGRRM